MQSGCVCSAGILSNSNQRLMGSDVFLWTGHCRKLFLLTFTLLTLKLTRILLQSQADTD